VNLDIETIHRKLRERKTLQQRQAEQMVEASIEPLLKNEPKLADLLLSGLEEEYEKRLKMADHLMRKTGYQTLVSLLPLMLQLKGKPYSLRDHFPFEPMFRTRMPDSLVYKCGRQVSKSTSLAAQGVLFSNCIPYFSTLYITPLFEMVRRFSQNYVRPFIETSPVAKLFMGSDTIQSVLQKSFHNHSMMHFSFAYLDAERTRGIAADKNVVDESVHMYTTLSVRVANGVQQKFIKDIQPGEVVLAFDENRQKVLTHVIKKWYAGYRRCYRLRTAGGRYVDCTSESLVATNAGCLRVSEIIETIAGGRGDPAQNCSTSDLEEPVDNETAAARARHDVGRWAPDKKRSVRSGAWMGPEGLSLAKAHAIARVRLRSTFEVEEERTRLRVGKILDCRGAGLSLLADPDVPGRHQACDSVVAGTNRSSGVASDSGLVDGGRRNLLGSAAFAEPCDLHQRIPARGGRTLVPMADGSWVSVARDDQACAWLPTISDGVFFSGSGSAAHARLVALDSAVHEVQIGDFWEGRSGDLSVLRATIPYETTAASHGFADLSLLLQERMPCRESCLPCTANQAETGAKTKETGLAAPVRATAARESAFEGTSSKLATSQSRKNAAAQGEIPHGAATKAEPNYAYLLGMQKTPGTDWACACHAQGTSGMSSGIPANYGQNQVPPQAPGGYKHIPQKICGGQLSRERTAEAYCLVDDPLVAIEDRGLDDVYDIETAEVHSAIFNGLAGPQCQDVDVSFLPVIHETMSGSTDWSLKQYSGTPKTLENTLQRLWEDSSQAEWVIPCKACHKDNIPTLQHDLVDMIGPWRPDISEERPGVICANPKCRRPLFPREGHWYHGHQDRRWSFAGYHVPQIILPMHYANPAKWEILVGKLHGRGNTPINVFFNEVCGESFDSGSKMVSVTDLKRAATLPWHNNVDEAKQHIGEYNFRFCCVDWGGGGVKGVGRAHRKPEDKYRSYTSIAVLGLNSRGEVHCLYGFRSMHPHEHLYEAKLIIGIMHHFQCSHLVHDYTGAGATRETIVHQAGLPVDRIIPVAYIGAVKGNIMRWNQATPEHPRNHWKCDKPRSLNITSQLIKSCMLKFFQYDDSGKGDRGLLGDFLYLIEDKMEGATGLERYRVLHDPAGPDDFAQAVNIGCMAMFQLTNYWPDIAMHENVYISDTVIQAGQSGRPQWTDI
jgi:hypothetical protein